MNIQPLVSEQATAYYNEEQHIIWVTYSGVLGADVTVQVYDWLNRLILAIGVDQIYGQIFDFSAVTEFQESNLQTARKTSKRMNIKVDTSHIPVALVVGNFYQEEILSGPMRVEAGHIRKRIVHSEAEALAFIEAWNLEHRETS